MNMKTFPRWLAVTLAAALLTILIEGVWFYRSQEKYVRQEVEKNLDAIADLKVDSIVAWRQSRLGSAATIMDNRFVRQAAVQWLKDPQPERAEELLALFTSLQTHRHYFDVLLIEPPATSPSGGLEARVRLSLTGQPRPLHFGALQAAADALRTRQPVLADLHRDPGESSPHIDAIAPLFDQNGEAAGAIVLQSDAQDFLYPLIQTWPTASRSAETLLVRADGDSVLFLNELRHRRDTVLSLRIPLTEKAVPAVMAVSGREGFAFGKDYRGVDVVSYLKPIPDSPWFIVAKMDKEEAFATWRLRSTLILISLLGLLAAVVSLLLFVWQHNAKQHYQALLQSETLRHTSEERYTTTLMSVGDGVIATDAKGRVEVLNPAAEKLTGWKMEEAHGKSLEEIFHIVTEETRAVVENPIQEVVRKGVVVGLANHTLLIARDGAERPIADCGAPIRDENGALLGVVLVIRDASDERRHSREREITLNLLRQLNLPNSMEELIRSLTVFLQTATGCEAVGIRLRVGDNYPYFETRGFSPEFVKAENELCARDLNGELLRDNQGQPILECMCGNILCGQCNPALPYYTDKGSFWTNSTTELLAADAEKDHPSHIHNRCNAQGYESVALIRLRTGDETLGLLQLNDRAKGRFTSELIAFLESAADQIAIGLAQRQSQKALRENEERLRGIINNAEGIIWVKDLDGRFLLANRYTEKLLGRSQEQIVGHTVYDLFPRETANAYEDNDRQIIQGGKASVFEETALLEDGTHTYLSVKFPLRDPGGRIYSIGAICTDITGRKKTEAERQRLESAIEQAAEIILITDAMGTIQYINPSFESVTGYARNEAVGHNPRFLKSGEQTEGLYRDLWAALSAGKTWQGRLINKRKDGSRYTQETTISPVRDETGRIVNYVAVGHDITRELNLEQQLLHAQKMESVGRLAGGVAHDFNNILQTILGYSEIALQDAGEQHALRENIQEIRQAAQRARDLTRQLLAFARKQTVHPQTVDLNDAIPGMLKMLRRLIGEDIDLAWMPGHEVWNIRIDPSQIDQLLANLTVNARDAIAGIGQVTIETSNAIFDEAYCAEHTGCVPGDYVLLAVSDDGSGMDKATQAHLFEPFFTTKGVGQGTGLGLATVYGIVKQNNGFINVYSEPGKGTTFKIYLPRFEGEAAQLADEKAEAATGGGAETILLVEDEPAVLKLGVKTLELLGYDVLSAGMPSEAIRLVQQHPGKIHLLITDVVMPEMNGRELAHRLMELKPDMKCLYMSGYTANTIAHRSILDEGVYFLQKPFSTQALAQKVRTVLEA